MNSETWLTHKITQKEGLQKLEKKFQLPQENEFFEFT